MRQRFGRSVMIAGVCLAGLLVGSASAQTTSSTETKQFEVVSVDGNQLVIRNATGTKEYTVPEDFRFDVDGKQLSVHDLKPGMKGTATVTTIKTVHPVTVTEVKNGQVMKVVGNSVIIRDSNNNVKMYSQSDVDKRQAKIMKDGQPVQVSELREGDNLTATIITEKPPKVMTERQVQATLAKGGESAASASGAAATSGSAGGGASGAAATGSGGGASAGGAAAGGKHLPKTASALPLVGLCGAISLAIALSLTALRRRQLL